MEIERNFYLSKLVSRMSQIHGRRLPLLEGVEVGCAGQEAPRKGSERITRNHEIDFIVNSGSRKLYIQSAFSMDGKKQAERETLPLKKTGDFFGKIVVRSGYMRPMQDDDGIMHVGLIPFLLEPEILSAALG